MVLNVMCNFFETRCTDRLYLSSVCTLQVRLDQYGNVTSISNTHVLHDMQHPPHITSSTANQALRVFTIVACAITLVYGVR